MSEGPHREPRRCECPACLEQPAGRVAQQHRDVNRLLACLDETARRLFVAVLARQHGRGGVSPFARVTGLSRNTIRLGITQLDQPPEHDGRVRRRGGGRPSVPKKAQA
jgi:hypothetical protein